MEKVTDMDKNNPERTKLLDVAEVAIKLSEERKALMEKYLAEGDSKKAAIEISIRGALLQLAGKNITEVKEIDDPFKSLRQIGYIFVFFALFIGISLETVNIFQPTSPVAGVSSHK